MKHYIIYTVQKRKHYGTSRSLKFEHAGQSSLENRKKNQNVIARYMSSSLIVYAVAHISETLFLAPTRGASDLTKALIIRHLMRRSNSTGAIRK
jgi:hypothetical protein